MKFLCGCSSGRGAKPREERGEDFRRRQRHRLRMEVDTDRRKRAPERPVVSVLGVAGVAVERVDTAAPTPCQPAAAEPKGLGTKNRVEHLNDRANVVGTRAWPADDVFITVGDF